MVWTKLHGSDLGELKLIPHLGHNFQASFFPSAVAGYYILWDFHTERVLKGTICHGNMMCSFSLNTVNRSLRFE